MTSSPLGELRTLLPESADLALSKVRRLNFRILLHLPDAFSEEADAKPLLETPYNCCALSELRTLFPESAELELSDGMRLYFRTVPHLPDAFSEEARKPLLRTYQITVAPLWKLRTILSESVDFGTFRRRASGFSRCRIYQICFQKRLEIIF